MRFKSSTGRGQSGYSVKGVRTASKSAKEQRLRQLAVMDDLSSGDRATLSNSPALAAILFQILKWTVIPRTGDECRKVGPSALQMLHPGVTRWGAGLCEALSRGQTDRSLSVKASSRLYRTLDTLERRSEKSAASPKFGVAHGGGSGSEQTEHWVWQGTHDRSRLKAHTKAPDESQLQNRKRVNLCQVDRRDCLGGHSASCGAPVMRSASVDAK